MAMMRAPDTVAETGAELAPSGLGGEVLGARWALGLAAALLLLLAVVEGIHWSALSGEDALTQVVQQPAPVSAHALHAEASAPDPGDNP